MWRLGNLIESTSPPHCSSGLLTVTTHFLDAPRHYSEKFERFPSIDTGPLENCNALIGKFDKVRSQRLSTGIHKTVENAGGAQCSVQRPRKQLQEDAVRASILKIKSVCKMVRSTLRSERALFFGKATEKT